MFLRSITIRHFKTRKNLYVHHINTDYKILKKSAVLDWHLLAWCPHILLKLVKRFRSSN